MGSHRFILCCSDITIPTTERFCSMARVREFDPVYSSTSVHCVHVDIRNFTATSWRRIIGVVPQDPVLFSGTIAENIAFGNSDATREEIEEAAREANCEFIWGMPDGFDTLSKLPSSCIMDWP